MRRNILLNQVGLFFLLMLSVIYSFGQTGNYVFSGSELTNFGIIDLATPVHVSWGTDRTASPGYFAALGTASYGNPSDAYPINGYVKHYADASNQTFSFPVGSGSDYRQLTVSGNRVANSMIGVAWIVGDPSGNLDPTSPAAGAHAITSLGTGLQSVSNIGQWDWQDLANNSAGVTVTVSIPNLSTFGIASELRLVGWDGKQWVNLSGATGASGNTENSTLSGIMITGITAIGVGKASDQDRETSILVTSILTGDWESKSTWDIGRVPQLGDYVIIDNNHIVTINTTAIAKKLQYRGTGKLKFNSTTSKLQMGF